MYRVQDFLRDPRGFMKDNLVRVTFQDSVAGVKDFTLKNSSEGREFRRDQQDSDPGKPLVELSGATASDTRENRFEAYWLPYDHGALYRLFLENAAPFMFTPTMSGCTFACSTEMFDSLAHPIWKNLPGQERGTLVSHSNYMFPTGHPDAGMIDQDLIDQEVWRTHAGRPVTTLIKPDYMTSNSPFHHVDAYGRDEQIVLTTFGLLEGGNWQFYCQQYEQSGLGDFRYLDFRKLKSV